jgi:acyl carrier protein
MTTRLTILAQIREVAAEQGRTLAPLTDDLSLMESGLDSLCFAILVARLEDALGADPFSAEGAVRYPGTVGELIAFYEDALV